MTDSQRRHADAIFQRALDLPAAEREAFVRDVCADDEALHEEVVALLRNDPGTEATMDAPVRLGPRGRFVTDPERVGIYRVLERLGEGAFGVVYEVEQTQPIRRRLALKLLKPGMDTEQVLARFEAERQALALMDHPNIARVIDAGATEQGRPYFVMELVKGDPLSVYCDRERLDLDARLDLFVDVCHAVQHAHQRGILHRDLKPSNVLVTRVDGEASVKVIDFGIAKALTRPLVDRTLHTVAGEVMGTPSYMSPEQSDPRGVDVDTASDVYSLGVVLYELLCGRLPERSADNGARRARKIPPSAHFGRDDEDAIRRAWWRASDPWQLASRLRGDLDWICMRAIARDRSRRYQTVQELLREIERHKRHEPVHAGPPGLTYRARKFVRRHWVGLGFAATVMLGLLVAGAGLTWALLRSNAQRAEIEAAQAESEAVLGFLGNMLASARPGEEGGDPSLRQFLDRTAAGLADEFGDRPLVEARLRTVIGESYRELGRWDEAADQLRRARRITGEHFDADHDRVLHVDREIAVLEQRRMGFDVADSLMMRIIEVRRAQVPLDELALAAALTDRSNVLVLANRDVEAIPLLEEALPLAERHVGPDHDLLSQIHGDLGIAYQARGDFEAAERSLLRAHAVDVQRLGADHVLVRWDAINLAAFYREIGDYEKALVYYADAHEAVIEIYGEDHPMTLRTENNLALVLSDVGRYDEALASMTHVVASRERLLGPDNQGTLASRLNLGLIHLRRRAFDEALPLTGETLRRCERSLGPDHLYTLIGLGHRAEVLRELGRVDEALTTIDDALARSPRALPEGHWRTGVWTLERGLCLDGLRRLDDAETTLLTAHRILDEQLGSEHMHTQDAIEALVRFFAARGDETSARRWRERVLARS